MESELYENRTAVNRYLGVTAVVLLIAFTTWFSSELSNLVYFFLSGYTAYLVFVVTKAWLDEREHFGRSGPIDDVMRRKRRGNGDAR